LPHTVAEWYVRREHKTLLNKYSGGRFRAFLTYFSVISEKFLFYFLVISRIFPISHLFPSVISRLFLTSQLFSQLFLSCASHFSVTLLSYFPFLSYASQLFLGYRLDPSRGFDINCRWNWLSGVLLWWMVTHGVKFPWQLAGKLFWFCTLSFVLVGAHINCQACGWRSSPISSV